MDYYNSRDRFHDAISYSRKLGAAGFVFLLKKVRQYVAHICSLTILEVAALVRLLPGKATVIFTSRRRLPAGPRRRGTRIWYDMLRFLVVLLSYPISIAENTGLDNIVWEQRALAIKHGVSFGDLCVQTYV